ncbi:MAG: hypothetical protein F4X11_20200 [Acidobacteria bacterium]|nr:hypothetical protein [Acidobacteriota bacterium]
MNWGDFRGRQGLPNQRAPYARIVAIDMNTGEHLWETPNGDTPERSRKHPALEGWTCRTPAFPRTRSPW